MEAWSSYSAANFIPFTAEVYLRLIERVNSAYWPLHLVTFIVGLIALAMAITGRHRIAGPALAILWACAAYGFLQQFYANLNWAGIWFTRLFYLQALGLALLMPFVCRNTKAPPASFWPGLLVACAGLLWPLLSVPGRESPGQMEVTGIHADPTAILTLGLLLLTVRGRWLLVLLPLPMLWCLISGLTLQVLKIPQAWLLYAMVATIALALAWGLKNKS